MAPDCGPWSVSGNQRPAELRLQDRLHDREKLFAVFQCMAEEQAKRGRIYNVEQPLGSAMWQELQRMPTTTSQDQRQQGKAED